MKIDMDRCLAVAIGLLGLVWTTLGGIVLACDAIQNHFHPELVLVACIAIPAIFGFTYVIYDSLFGEW